MLYLLLWWTEGKKPLERVVGEIILNLFCKKQIGRRLNRLFSSDL
jgi:hypothetical protein